MSRTKRWLSVCELQARSLSAFLIVVLAVSGLLIAGPPGHAQQSGFNATISGAYGGQVTGDGVLQWIGIGGFSRKGYFFLSDGQGDRSHGVTFVLPLGIEPGRYKLENPTALAIGSVSSVRVDRVVGDAVFSANKNTSGFIELDSFPADESALGATAVTGRFAFDTEDANGQKITVTGEFSFRVE